MPRPASRSPALHFDPALLLAAQGIKLVVLAIDEPQATLNAQDTCGLSLLTQAGIASVAIAGSGSPELYTRLQAAGVAQFQCGSPDKLASASRIVAELGIGWSQVAMMAQDWADLPVLERCAFACSAPTAHAEVRHRCDHVTQAAWGQGAVRELCDLLLCASGQYATLLAKAAGETQTTQGSRP